MEESKFVWKTDSMILADEKSICNEIKVIFGARAVFPGFMVCIGGFFSLSS
jgi:hypothetical protein